MKNSGGRKISLDCLFKVYKLFRYGPGARAGLPLWAPQLSHDTVPLMLRFGPGAGAGLPLQAAQLSHKTVPLMLRFGPGTGAGLSLRGLPTIS